MTTLHLPSATVGLRQALATGRAFERFTELGFAAFTASLAYRHPGGGGVFATTLASRPAGYFALLLSPERDMPDLAAAGAVELTLTLEIPGRAPIALALATTGADLAVVEETRRVAGQEVVVRRVAGAPFRFAAAVPPRPVLLDGLVLFDNDPDTPAAGVGVTAQGAPPVVSDAEGRFRIPALPLVESVMLRFAHGAAQTDQSFRPDYGQAAMAATFAIPSP